VWLLDAGVHVMVIIGLPFHTHTLSFSRKKKFQKMEELSKLLSTFFVINYQVINALPLPSKFLFFGGGGTGGEGCAVCLCLNTQYLSYVGEGSGLFCLKKCFRNESDGQSCGLQFVLFSAHGTSWFSIF